MATATPVSLFGTLPTQTFDWITLLTYDWVAFRLVTWDDLLTTPNPISVFS